MPLPRDLPSLVASGPILSCSADCAEAAALALLDALAEAAEDEADPCGWSAWWASPPSHAGNVARLVLWFADDSGGRRSLEAASFLVQVRARASTPAPVLRGRSPLHARLGTARFGTLAGDLAVLFEVDDGLVTVQVEPRWSWPGQPCPNCGHHGHPVERIAGFPTDDAWSTVALGEAVLAGCRVDEADDHDAECARCGRGFAPRG